MAILSIYKSMSYDRQERSDSPRRGGVTGFVCSFQPVVLLIDWLGYIYARQLDALTADRTLVSKITDDLVPTARANELDPYTYLRGSFAELPAARTALTLIVLMGLPCSSIASSPSGPIEPAVQVLTDTDATTTAKIVSRLYQATFGASERCKMAPAESADEFKVEFDRFRAKYPDLLNLLKSSPFYEPARQHFAQLSASMAARDTPRSLAAECKGLAQLVRSMIDQPEGQEAVRDYTARLSAK